MADDIIQQVEIQGGDDVAKAFADIGNAGAEAFSKIAEAAAHGDFTALAESIGGPLAGAFTKIGEAVLEFTESEAKAMETSTSLASAIGATNEQFFALQGAAAGVGISVQGFDRSMGRLAMSVSQAWAGIVQNVRESGQETAQAQLGVEEATNNVTKAYQQLDNAIQSAAQHAAHAATDMQQANLNLQKALLTQDKDNGGNTAADEKVLQQQQDALNVQKARQAIADMQQKQAEQEVADAQKVRDAQMNIEKAIQAKAAAEEKAHEVDLKNLPQIAQQINQVVQGYKQWNDIANVSEITAQNLRNAIILAASPDGKQPSPAAVFDKLIELFPKMGTSIEAVNAKTEILQHLLASGFRAGQASVAQWMRMLDQGKESVDKFDERLKALQQTGLGFTTKDMGIKDSDQEKLDKFEDSWSQLGAILQNIAGHFAAIISTGITPFLDRMTNSLTSSNGVLNHIAQALGIFVQGLASAAAAIGPVLSLLGTWVEMVGAAFNLSPVQTWLVLIAGVAVALAPIPVAIGLVVIAIGEVISHWDDFKSAASDAVNAVVGYFQGIIDKINDVVQSIEGALKGALQDVVSVLGKIFGGGGGGGAGAGGAATGGLIRGPGGPTDDRAGLWALSDGEYVVKAAAVQHYGTDLFHALNNIAVGGFATGGLVGRPTVAVASPAGPGGPTSIVNLHLDGQSFNGLRAPEGVAAKLKAYAVTRETSATGRSPSWRR